MEHTHLSLLPSETSLICLNKPRKNKEKERRDDSIEVMKWWETESRERSAKDLAEHRGIGSLNAWRGWSKCEVSWLKL